MTELSDDQFEKTSDWPLGQQYDPLAGKLLDNPHPFYARARQEEPVFFSERLQSWIVTRYDDVQAILAQPGIFSSKDTLRPAVSFMPETFQILATGYAFVPVITNTDGNEHQRFRVPLNHVFLPARLKTLEGLTRTIANRLIDSFFKEGQAEIIARFAGPLPQEIILRLLGIPEEDLVQCKSWSDDVHALTEAPLPPERQVECARSMVAFQQYCTALIEKRRHTPQDDLVTALLTVRPEHTQPLTMAEMVNMLIGVFIAGHQTVTNLISSALHLLLSQREYWQAICQRPASIPTVVEEVLRFSSPVQTFHRTALRETQVGGVTIPEGALLLVVFSSANRDEAHFGNPDQFELERSPNRHLAFGYGVHFCVGAPLARLEGRIALETLSQHLPELHLQPGQTLNYLPRLMFRGLEQLKVAWQER